MIRIAIAAAMIGVVQAPKAPPPPLTTIVLVRHAEAVANAGTDPDLTDQGRARADALVEALKDSRITAVLSTPYRRTTQTAGPIAKAQNTPVVPTPIAAGAAGIDAHIKQVVRMVHEQYTGGTVLIVGHSNTVPALVKALSGVDPGEIAHDAFDRMFIVTTNTPGAGRVIRARYGPR